MCVHVYSAWMGVGGQLDSFTMWVAEIKFGSLALATSAVTT